MKKMMFTLIAMLTMTVSASAMSYEQARNEALFLTDKMAYELNLSDAQYEAAYEINLDYLMSVASYDDVFGTYWERRNLDLSYILFSWQWDLFRAATYFYRPLYWEAGFWHFGIYARYPRRDYFYFGRPHFYATYRGGHSWRMNGGHSYYHGRRDDFRRGRDNHFGMRDSWDRGDYRGGRSNSSTRVTAGRNDRPGTGNGNNQGFGRGTHGDDNTNVQPGNNGRSNGIRPNNGSFGGNRVNNNGSAPTRSTINVGREATNRPVNIRNTVPQRSTVTTPQRSTVTTPQRSTVTTPQRSTVTTPQRSTVTTPQRSTVTTPTRSSATSTSSRSSHSSGSSSHSSNSHGNFGGSRK